MGLQKRLRMAEKANYALETLTYYSAPKRAVGFDGVVRMAPKAVPTPVSPGVIRASRRLAERQKFNMTIPGSKVKSRQQQRAEARRRDKMPVGASQAAWHKLNGFPKV